MNRQLLWTLLVACSMGLVVGIQLAGAAPPNDKICGGKPDAAEPTKRTNNANCKSCNRGCQIADKKYKTCEAKKGEDCHTKFEADITDLLKCDGELWDKEDCTGMSSGTCQDNVKHCE